jgi:hypothetical protein
MPAAGELDRGLAAFWAAYGLDWVCKQHWRESLRDRFLSLNDTTAAPESQFPYCVFRFGESEPSERSTGYSPRQKREYRDVPLELVVFSKQLPTGGQSAKAIAIEVAEQIMQKLGGHPTAKPNRFTLAHSNHLLTQLLSHYGMAEEEDCYTYTLNYSLKIDSPVMAGGAAR